MAKNNKKTKQDTKKTLEQFSDAFKSSIDYCRPQWEAYLRFYGFWRGIKPAILDSTISGIWLNIFHSIVQQRKPQIFENVFSNPEYVTLKADSPEYDLMVEPTQTWLRDLLDEKIKIRSDAEATITSTLIGGTGFRMPYVRYVERDGQQVPIISSKDLCFFNVLPSPNGSLINPSDHHRDDAVDWMCVIGWMREDIIKQMKNSDDEGWNSEQIDKLLANRDAGVRGEEDNYKDQFKQINGMSYDGYGAQYLKNASLPDGMKKRRVVHWYLRDRHVIVAEDAYVIYDGEPPLGEGIIPVVKYCITPDLKNFYGISQIEMVEDLVMAMIMNYNYRMDHMIGVMFPTVWIRDDIWRGKSEDDFIPRPYSVNRFPTSITNPRDAIYYDRRPEVTQQTFMDEDRMKAFLQNISGELETSGSYGDVVGNRTAYGVSAIQGALKARPGMEAAILEETGFREEITLLLKLGDMHITTPQRVRVKASSGATAWQRVSPLDITDKFTVVMHGTKFMSEKQESFNKLLALYPYWNNNPGVDMFELNNDIAKTHNIVTNPDKIFVPPAPPPVASQVGPPASQGGVGGAASAMDITQGIRSRQRENSPQAQEQRREGIRVL